MRINESEDTKTHMQLCPYTIWNEKLGSKISTRVLAIECENENVKEVKRIIYAKLFNVPKSMEHSNTRFFEFIPFSPAGAIIDKVIRSGIYLQIKFLTESTAITIVQLSKVDWKVPNISKTFRELVLDVNIEGDDNNIFFTVEMGTSDNKAHLVTTKEYLNATTEWMDSFTK